MKKKLLAVFLTAMITISTIPFSATAFDDILSKDYYNKEIDYSLWDKFLKYDLCITDYNSLTEEQKELCEFIFETERSAKGTIICERARRTLAGDKNIGERITLEQLENAYGIWDNYSSNKSGFQNYIHCVPDIKCLDGWDSYNEYWTDDEGSYRIRFTGENTSYMKNFEVHGKESFEIEPKKAAEFIFDYEDDKCFFKSDDYLEYNGDYYYIKPDGTAVFAKSKHSRRDEPINCEPVTKTVVVPDEINGYPVIAIENEAFLNACVTEVILPETIKFIDSSAFWECIYLEKINFPQSLKYIGLNAFSYCSELKEIDIDNPNLYLSDSAFQNCWNITSINLNVRNIGENAFSNCRTLKKVVLGESVEMISSKAFYNCDIIENIQFPSTLKFIGAGAFSGAINYSRSGIKSIVIPSTLKLIGAYPRKTGVGATSGIYVPATDPLTEEQLCAFDPDCTIYGYTNTEAEFYAKEWNLKFIDLDSQTEKWDINLDGETNSADIVLMYNYLHGKATLIPQPIDKLDLNGDAAFNVFDVILLRRTLLKNG